MTDFIFGGGAVGSVDVRGVSSQDIADTLTTTTPITVLASFVQTPLTNNGLGLNTGTDFLASGISQLYDTSTNSLDFSDLAIGDVVNFRVDISLTTSGGNHDVEIGLLGGIGGAFPFALPFYTRTVKKTGLNRIVASSYLLIRSASTRDNPARFYISTDGIGADTCIVNGWTLSHSPRLPLV